MISRLSQKALLATATAAAFAGNALAADGFKVRFPLSGTFGGEIVAPIGNPGVFGSLVATQIEVDKLTGNDGNPMTQIKSGSGVAPLLGGPYSYAGNVKVGLKQSQTQINAILGYLSHEEYGGGRMSFTINIPQVTVNRTTTFSGATPGLTPTPVSPYATPVNGAFNISYQAALASASTLQSGNASDLGDIEMTAAWVSAQQNSKVVAGVTLVAPTGRYDKNVGVTTAGVNIGYGDFYTLRPGLAMSYDTSDTMTVAGRVSLGLNSPNTSNGIRSGNYYAVDLAAAYKTPVGVVGPHFLQVTQYEDDQGGTLGANRFSSTGAGFFYATLIPSINAGLNISYMQTVDSRNSLSGSFIQFRLSKAF